MTKHTPGPWFVERLPTDLNGAWIHDGGRHHIAENVGGANTHLIAAAPDLLAAAKEALAFLTANGMSHGKSLAAAIAKAELADVENKGDSQSS